MKKRKMRKAIALSLALALSQTLLSGYTYPAVSRTARSETAHPDPDRVTTDHTVAIVTDLSKTYDGEMVDTPIFKVDNMDTDTSMTYHYIWYYKWNADTSTFEPHEETPREAGRYRVKITVCPSGHGSIENPYAEGNRNFEIAKAPNSWITELNEIDGKIVAKAAHGDVTYQHSENEDGPYADGLPPEDGDWYVKAIAADPDGNYETLISEPVLFHVEFDIKREIVFDETSVNSLAKQYDGQPVQCPEFTISGPSQEAAVKWYLSNEDKEKVQELSSPPVNAGYYKLEVAAAKVEGYGSVTGWVWFQIGKATNYWTETLTISDIGAGKKPQPNAEAAHGTVKYLYSQAGSGPYTEELPNVPGTWWVKAIVEEDENYARLESMPVKFTVLQERHVVIGMNPSKTYDGRPMQLPHYQITGPNSYDTKSIKWYLLNADGSIAYEVSKPVNAGKYRLEIVPAPLEGYEDGTSTWDFEITKAQNNWTQQLTISDITFGDNPEPKAEAAYGNVSYQYSHAESGPYTDVPPVFPGTWYVKAVVEDRNYENLESAPVEFTVRATNEWTEELSMADITFGETPAPNASAVYGTVKYQYSQSEAGPYTEELPDTIGVWYVKAVVDGDTTYNGLESVPVRFEVKKEANEWEKELTISNIALGEKPAPKAEAAHGTVKYWYSQTETGSYTEEFPNVRGTWYVKAVVAAGDTYDGLESDPVSFEVGKRKNEWTTKLTMFDVILGDKPEPKAEVAHGTVKYQYSRNEEGPYSDALPDVPGTWYVKAIVEENETYALLESEAVSFVLIDLDEYVPPVEPDKPDNPDKQGNPDKPGKPEEDKKDPSVSGQPGDKVDKLGNTVMTPTDTKKKSGMNTAQTGDPTSVMGYLLLLGGSFVFILMLSRKKRSTNSDKN